MTQASVAEVVRAVRPRYLRARRRDKTRTLDEFVARTGYHRKAAIRVLRNGRKPNAWDRRGRPRVYTNDVKAALLEVWEICGHICSKRLAPFLGEIVAVVEREGELRLPPGTKRLLVRMSPATIDRLLKTHRYKRPRSRRHEAGDAPQARDPHPYVRGVGRRPARVCRDGPRGPLRREHGWRVRPHPERGGRDYRLVRTCSDPQGEVSTR